MISQQEYNEWFKEMLSKFPLNHEYKITEESYEEEQYLNVTISHPSDAEKNIVISTHGKELTLCIWKHHEHHDSFEDDDHENEFIVLSNYIDDIINDEVFFAVGYRGEKITYGSASDDIKDLLDDKVDTIEIKTWSGKQDKTINNKG
jgi:hypothetical protein